MEEDNLKALKEECEYIKGTVSRLQGVKEDVSEEKRGVIEVLMADLLGVVVKAVPKQEKEIADSNGSGGEQSSRINQDISKGVGLGELAEALSRLDSRCIPKPEPYNVFSGRPLEIFLREFEEYCENTFKGGSSKWAGELRKFLVGRIGLVYEMFYSPDEAYWILKEKLLVWCEESKNEIRKATRDNFEEMTINPGESMRFYAARMEKAFKLAFPKKNPKSSDRLMQKYMGNVNKSFKKHILTVRAALSVQKKDLDWESILTLACQYDIENVDMESMIETEQDVTEVWATSKPIERQEGVEIGRGIEDQKRLWEQRELYCPYCKKKGHTKSECRRLNNLCLICGSGEHKIATCPKRRSFGGRSRRGEEDYSGKRVQFWDQEQDRNAGWDMTRQSGNGNAPTRMGTMEVNMLRSCSLNDEDKLESDEITLNQILVVQASDILIDSLRHAVRNELPVLAWASNLKPFKNIKNKLEVTDNVLCYRDEKQRVPVVSFGFLCEIAVRIHCQMSHCGRNKLIQKLKSLLWHPEVYKVAGDVCAACMVCQKYKIHSVIPSPPILKIVPSRPFELVAADLVLLPKTARSFVGCLVVIDLYSKWLSCAPVRNKKATTIASTFEHRILPSLPAKPVKILSDNGSEFTGVEFENILSKYGISHIYSTPYKPSSNGAVERCNRTLIEMLRCMKGNSNVSWDMLLPEMVVKYNNSWHASIKMSPVQNIIRVNHDITDAAFIPTEVKQVWKSGQSTFSSYGIGDEVMVKEILVGNCVSNKLSPRFHGPYRIVKIGKSGLTYTLDKNGSIMRVHHSQIRKFVPRPTYIGTSKQLSSVWDSYQKLGNGSACVDGTGENSSSSDTNDFSGFDVPNVNKVSSSEHETDEDDASSVVEDRSEENEELVTGSLAMSCGNSFNESFHGEIESQSSQDSSSGSITSGDNEGRIDIVGREQRHEFWSMVSENSMNRAGDSEKTSDSERDVVDHLCSTGVQCDKPPLDVHGISPISNVDSCMSPFEYEMHHVEQMTFIDKIEVSLEKQARVIEDVDKEITQQDLVENSHVISEREETLNVNKEKSRSMSRMVLEGMLSSQSINVIKSVMNHTARVVENWSSYSKVSGAKKTVESNKADGSLENSANGSGEADFCGFMHNSPDLMEIQWKRKVLRINKRPSLSPLKTHIAECRALVTEFRERSKQRFQMHSRGRVLGQKKRGGNIEGSYRGPHTRSRGRID